MQRATRPRWPRPDRCRSWNQVELEPMRAAWMARRYSSTPNTGTEDLPPVIDDAGTPSAKSQGKRPFKSAYRPSILTPNIPSASPSNPTSISAINKALSADPSRPPLTRLHFAHSDEVVRHLAELLDGLPFDEATACRMMTAKSAATAKVEARGFVEPGVHNSKLAFLGRRMLNFALSSFLATAPVDRSLLDAASSRSLLTGPRLVNTLDTRLTLGAFVGRAWRLEKIMRWREVSGSREAVNGQMMGTGLYTTRGEAVEAIMGGIMSRHGTRLALATFHSRVLPFMAHRLGPEHEVAIEAVRRRDEDLSDPKAGLGPLEDLPLDEVAEEMDRRNAPAQAQAVAASG